MEAGRDPPAGLAGLLAGPVVDAARGLLGAWLVRGDATSLRIGRIVETEAYDGPEDLASHARFGRTSRNGSMFGPLGHAYIYRVYGMHTCLNVVCGPPGRASAVLVRAVEPVTGVAEMREARRSRGLATRRAERDAPDWAAARIATLPVARVASGPGNVGAAFSIVPEDDGCDLLDPASPLRLGARSSVEPRPPKVASGPRVGVAFAGAWAERRWRFWVAGSLAVSGGRVR